MENNNLLELAKKLKENIKQNDIFSETLVLVPNKSIEQWFKTFWLQNNNDVLMNVKFRTLKEGMFELFELSNYQSIVSPSLFNYFVIKALTTLSKDQLGDAFSNYIYQGEEIDSTKLYDLSSELTKLFVKYENDLTLINDVNQKAIYDFVMNELNRNSLSTIKHLVDNKVGYKTNKTIHVFGVIELDKLTNKIIDDFSKQKNNKVIYYNLKNCDNKPEINLVACPSKEREITVLHSKICELLKNKEVTYKDFLVLAPNIKDYEVDIARVFKQDDENFPNIPYIINNINTKPSELTNALNILFNVLKKGFFTRFDFIDLITNKMIMESRNIDYEDIQMFKKMIVEMNIYRYNDWEYAKKRVVLSKLLDSNQIGDNIISLDDQKYISYSNISLSDESKVKFIKLIDDLNCWIDLFKDNPTMTNDEVDKLKSELAKWFSILDYNKNETNTIYQKIIMQLNNFEKYEIYSDKSNKVTLFTLIYMLLKNSEEVEVSSSNLFLEGISFMDYLPNIVLQAKYIFFIGASSNNLPKNILISEFDLSGVVKQDDYNHFKLQAQNAESLFNISYVNKNLKTDEDFFPSSFVINLLKEYKIIDKNVKNKEDYTKVQKLISLDEERDWKDLYTKKEFKNRDFYYGLFNTDDNTTIPSSIISRDEKSKVKVSEIVNFLKEPLKYKADQLFKVYDNISENLENEYETLKIDSLTNSSLVNKVASYLLKHKKDNLTEDEIDELFLLPNLKHSIPQLNNDLNEFAKASVIKKAKDIYKKIYDETNGKYEVKVLEDLNLDDNNKIITITSKDEICISRNGNEVSYYELKEDKDKNEDYIKLYVSSLIDIVQNESTDTFTIKLIKTKTNEFDVNFEKAKKILIEILEMMNDYEDNKCCSINKLNKEENYNNFIENFLGVGQDKPWCYYKDKKLFDDHSLGYNEDDFDQQIKDMKVKMSDIILFLKKDDEKNEKI